MTSAMDGKCSPRALAVADDALLADGVLSNLSTARIARHEVLSHVIETAKDTPPAAAHANDITTPKRKGVAAQASPEAKGVKRRISHDSVMAKFDEERPAKKPKEEPHPLHDGHVLEAEYIAAEYAARKASTRGAACQVCGLARDKWAARTPLLFLNARQQPVTFPGSFCSKDCFFHV